MLCAFPAIGRGEPPEPVPIASLLQDPDSHHLKEVTLKGTVRHVEELPPYFLQTGSACYGAYRFMLVDESGLLPISVLGLCGRPMIKSPDVSDGDVIVVDVAIEAADSATRARAADLPTDEERTAGMIRAVAKRITQLGQ